MKVSFTILGEPKAKGRPRFTKNGSPYTPEDTAIYENLVKVEYIRQCKKQRFPDDAQLEMRIFAYYSIPKSASKKRKDEMMKGTIRPTKKPDIDNIVKIIADSLNQVAYKDDSQIIEMTVTKHYSEEPRVTVLIEDMGK